MDDEALLSWKEGYSVTPEAMANAHLIAAAPDLYAALNRLDAATTEYRRCCDLLGASHMKTVQFVEEVNAAQIEARTALARARGES
jgi:hypothetical protein